MANRYLSSVARIMDRGRNTNSYKFALLRALVAEVKPITSRPLELSNRQLAQHFIRLYWPLTLRFKIRQATVPGKDPVVMRHIRRAIAKASCSEEIKVEDFRCRFGHEYEQLASVVTRQAFRDVIPRFHTINGHTVEPRLYDIEADHIVLSPDVQEFIFDSAKALDLLAIGAWVKFTERYTSSPRLFEKIQGSVAKRKDLGKYADFFISLGFDSCFYCQGSLTKGHIDHVIPWRFIAEDKVWNLVRVCERCNSSKSSSTPEDRFVYKVIDRNQDLLRLEPTSLRQPIKQDLSGWRSEELAEHFRMLVSHCRSDGFGTWGPSKHTQ